MPWIDITESLIPVFPPSCPGNRPEAPRYEMQPEGFWRAIPRAYPPGDPSICVPGTPDSVPPGYAGRESKPSLLYTGPDIEDVTRYRIQFQFVEPASSHELYEYVSDECDGSPGCRYVYVRLDGNNCYGCGSDDLDVNNTSLQTVTVDFPSGVWQNSTTFGAYIQFATATIPSENYLLCGDVHRVEVWTDAAAERFWTNFVGCQEL